jgi:putative FmdB family regulatory protein
MPIYEYRCRACQRVFEAIRPLGDDGKDLSCPACGEVAPEKILSVFAAGAGSGGCASGGGFT